MNSRLSFDLYAEITDPPCHVTHEAHDSRVSVTVGGTRSGISVNLLQLWFIEPDTILKLGRDLISAGMSLAAQRANATPGSTESWPQVAEPAVETEREFHTRARDDHRARTPNVKLVRLREGIFATGSPVNDGHTPPRVVHAVDSSVDLGATDGVTALCGAHFAPNTLLDAAEENTTAHRLCLRRLPSSPAEPTEANSGAHK